MRVIDVLGTLGQSEIEWLSYAAQQRENDKQRESIQSLLDDLYLREEDLFEDEVLLIEDEFLLH